MAKPTFGTTLRLGASGGALTALTKLVTITPPKISREAVDATTHASEDGAAEYMADGVHDNGEITGTIDYVAGDADDDLLLAAATASGLYDAEFTANAANGTETFSCSGIFTSYGPDELPVSGNQTSSFTF